MKTICHSDDMGKVTIYGQVPSKSNGYRIITICGHSSLGKTKALKDYERKFYLQCPMRGAELSKPFRLVLDVYYSSNRPDLDNAFKIVLDCLQQCKAIKNDRYCYEIVARKLVDKAKPRVELELEELID